MRNLRAQVLSCVLLSTVIATPVSADGNFYEVNTSNDLYTPDGLCSLREAMLLATEQVRKISDCLKPSGLRTIVLRAGVNPNVNTVLPTISGRQVSILGVGNTNTITPPIDSNIFTIQQSGTLTLEGLSLGRESSVASSGFLVSTDSNLQISETRIFGSSGAIRNVRGSTIIRKSHLLNNKCENFEGASIYNDRGAVFVFDSNISENIVNSGGAIFNYFGRVSIERSSIANNSLVGPLSAAIFNRGGEFYVYDSAVFRNQASDPQLSGGVYNEGFFQSSNTTFSANNSGIVSFGELSLAHVTIYNQIGNALEIAGGDAVVSRSIIATDSGLGDCILSGGEISALNNLISSRVDACNIAGNSNLIGVNPKLSALGMYGGPTPSHALDPASPAVDNSVFGCQNAAGFTLLADQRGYSRPADGNNDGFSRCDLGAFELGPVGIGVLTPTEGESQRNELVLFNVGWDSPGSWRELRTIDLRVLERKKLLFTLRFVEGVPSSFFELLDAKGRLIGRGEAGEDRLLEDKNVQLSLKESGFSAEGAEAPHVDVAFAVRFKKAYPKGLETQLAASDDRGAEQAPDSVGTWNVSK